MKAKDRYFKNRNMLLNYVEQSNTPELKQFIDSMLMVERCNENTPKARLELSIGKAEYKNGEFVKFISNLNSRTDYPSVFVSAVDNEPQIIIQDRLYHNASIALINLTDINNLHINKSKNSETYLYISCTFHSLHNNIDYNISLEVTK